MNGWVLFADCFGGIVTLIVLTVTVVTKFRARRRAAGPDYIRLSLDAMEEVVGALRVELEGLRRQLAEERRVSNEVEAGLRREVKRLTAEIAALRAEISMGRYNAK